MSAPQVYVPLEGNFIKSVGGGASFSIGATPSLFTSSSFIYTFAFVVIVVVASFRYAYAGMLRMQASEKGISDSKAEFKRVTYGLLGVFGLWLILFTVNKDMLTGDVSLSGLRTSSVVGGNSVVGVVPSTPSGISRACDSEATVKASVLPGGSGICGNTPCSLTSCMTNNQYLPFIKSVAGNDWKMALVIMCKESAGNKVAQNKNSNGTYDCGLMQVNQNAPCDASILDPQTNITKGVAILREKLGLSSNATIYPTLKVRPETAVFTSYNCCSNGTIPNSESASCKTSEGWPSIPKWACPIDPGVGDFNMCGVKAYACELTACLNSI